MKENGSVQRIGKTSPESPFVYEGELFRLRFESQYPNALRFFGFLQQLPGEAESWLGHLNVNGESRLVRVVAEVAEGPWLGFWLVVYLISREVQLVDSNSVVLAGNASATPDTEINGLQLDDNVTPTDPGLTKTINEAYDIIRAARG